MAVELSRNVTFGQYLDLRSPIHRLDPRTKILALGMLMLAIFLSYRFTALGILLLCATLTQSLARISIGYTLRSMRLLMGTLLIVVAFQVLFFPNPTPTGIFWQWSFLSFSSDGLRQGLLVFVRVMLLYHLVSMLMFTTTMMDLADGMELLLAPLAHLRVPVNESVMALVIAIKFVPLLIAELERLIKAQSARGIRFDRGGLITRARRLGALLVPLFINAFERAEVLTTAMNARCYRGGVGRTKRRVLRLRSTDGLALGVALCFAVGAMFLSRIIPF